MPQFELDYYLAASFHNLGRLSRTLQTGVIDTKYSGASDKPKGAIDDPIALKEVAERNIVSCVNTLFLSRSTEMTAGSFESLFLDIASKARAHTIEPGAPVYRRHEIQRPEYGCPVFQVVPSMERFYQFAVPYLNDRLDQDTTAQVSGLFEQIIDKDIHGLADGCGRVAKLMSVFLAMRNDTPVKVLPNRTEYYAATAPKRGFDSMFSETSAAQFMTWYADLPDFIHPSVGSP